jgi:hypothetical protein
MKYAKKMLIALIVSLLAFNVMLINASAYTEPASLLGVDIDLEVGRYSGGVFTPLTEGEALYTNDVITVRIAPTTDFLTGITRYVAMFTKSHLQVVGTGKAAFTPNTANTFYATVCSDYAGITSIPESAWPPALKSVAAGGNGTFTTNSAVAVNNLSNIYAPNGGYPGYLTGEWLFRFDLRVTQDITPGSGVKIWMDNQWVRRPGYTNAQMYFTKCLDSERLSSDTANNNASSTIYFFDVDLTGANISLEPAAEVNITFDANGGTGGTGPTAMTPGDPLTAPAVARAGYVLAGWSPTLPATVPTSDTTYVAQWVQTAVTVTMVDDEFIVNIQGWTASSKYQIWSYQQVTSDALLAGTADVQANQWILSMPYAAGSTGDVQLDGSINFTIDSFTSPTENYVIAVRVADAGNNFVQEIRDAYTPEDVQEVIITKVLVDGAVTTGYELREITGGAQTLIKVIGNNVANIVYTATQLAGPTAIDLTVSNTNEFLWDISALDPGIYKIQLEATNGTTIAAQLVTFELFSLSTSIDYGSIDDMTLAYDAGVVDITPTFADGTFSYRLREPNRAPIYRSVEYSNAGPFEYAISAPGVYVVHGYVTRAGLIGTENGGFDDGLVRTLVIPRTGGSGTASMTFTADQTLPEVAKGTAITFTAQATGLPDTEYSFWRNDATGSVLVKDWSTSNTLDWTPARVGEYTLEARAKGAGAGSFELKKTLEVNITDTVEEIAAVTGITINDVYLNANAQGKKPIVIQANATSTNGNDLLYKFTVYDADMRGLQLKDYSVDQYCVWTPREAGTYTISVLVKNSVSFGMFDAIESWDITVD